MAGPGWTSERDDMLSDLWATGLSCSMIADRINRSFPGSALTPNAIIGRVHRLKLGAREKSVCRDGATRGNPNHYPRKPKAAPKPKVERKSPVLHGKLAPRVKVEGEAPPKPSSSRNSRFFLPPAPRPAVVEAQPEPPAPPMVPEVPAAPITILELTATSCRWPVDPVGEHGWRFCGRQRDPNDPKRWYCPEHRERSIGRIYRRGAA